MGNYSTLAVTSVVSAILWRRNMWINMDPEYLFSETEPYKEYFVIFGVLCLYFIFDKPESFEYALHHNANLVGIVWMNYNNKCYGMLNNMLMFEFSTPVLCLYLITKRVIFVPLMIVLFVYYRIYNCIVHLRYLGQVDIVITGVHLINTGLNLYWFSKICRKCYIKLLQ